MTERELFARWIGSLRLKAQALEHPQPPGDRMHPTLDDLCWEMKAYLAGRDVHLDRYVQQNLDSLRPNED